MPLEQYCVLVLFAAVQPELELLGVELDEGEELPLLLLPPDEDETEELLGVELEETEDDDELELGITEELLPTEEDELYRGFTTLGLWQNSSAA